MNTSLARLASDERSVPSGPAFESLECALTALDALAARNYVRLRPARSQEPADQWLKYQAACLNGGLDIPDWGDADSPLLAAGHDAVERGRTAFPQRTLADENACVPADQPDADLQDGFEMWFSGLRSRLADSGISVGGEARLDRCGVALEGHGVTHMGCVRTIIVRCGIVSGCLSARLLRATRLVPTLYSLEQIDKAAGEWPAPNRRLDAEVLCDGSLAKIDELW